ncbi:SHIPPO 1-like protein [Spironucleus salmonicida]|uniref:SHIPPO 1-like protein n=1 Tax=Spironucleus salmonicida TaxID=348837 RepID=V6LTU1_9EUKA|nr:SHIPPO 1-like protein [Spironucleus salmonicida]|eukprot:EST48077.1 SHIPPO 1-like protein [Spironucleus salmonicida]
MSLSMSQLGKSTVAQSQTMVAVEAEQSFTPGVGSYNVSSSFLKTSHTDPSYSLASRFPDKSMSNPTGPGDYENNGSSLSRIGGSISKAERGSKINPTPGPGDYNVKSELSQIGATISGRPVDLSTSQTPGPADYNAETAKLKNLARNPAYTLSGRTSVHSNKVTPSCCDYNPNYSSIAPDSHGSKFPKYEEQKDIQPGPGPADYNKTFQRKQISTALSSRYNNPSRDLFSGTQNGIPGPAEYQNNQKVQLNSSGAGKIANKYEDTDLKERKKYANVGPGAYNNRKLASSANQFSFPKQEDSQLVRSQTGDVGPGNYDIGKSSLSTSGYSVSGRPKDLYLNTNPGVGAYNIDRSDKEKFGSSMSGRHDKFRNMYNFTNNTPGIGSYTLDQLDMSKRGKGSKFPKYEPKGAENTNPGVGSYNVTRAKSSQGFTMGGRYKGRHF